MPEKPPFTVSSQAQSLVMEITALLERMAPPENTPDALKLRRANQIKTIQATLAIEGNTLSMPQVTAIVGGKPVIAPPREIQEVKNAVAAYELAPSLNPFSVADLLTAHQVMMAALIEEAGAFRRGGVGVSSGTQVIHIAPPPELVPKLIDNLLAWVAADAESMLIRSCVFHYEFEFIHPFADGNGRMGRLWQSLLLAQLHPVFFNLPVETLIHNKQAEYYHAINRSSAEGDSGCFIDFMLGEIAAVLREHQQFCRND